MDGSRTPRDISIAAMLLIVIVGIITGISFGIKGATGSDKSSSTNASKTVDYPDVVTSQPTPQDRMTLQPTTQPSMSYYYDSYDNYTNYTNYTNDDEGGEYYDKYDNDDKGGE